MKSIHLAAVAAISLTAAAAHAEPEGAGEPFAHHAPGITVMNPQPYADSGSAAYPDLRNRSAMAVKAGGGTVAVTGSEAGVQTANSLPRDFTAGTDAYAQNRSMNRSMQRGRAEQAFQPARAALVSDGKPRG